MVFLRETRTMTEISSPRIPLYYTFGNHMHWVNMEWLWGYNVLPDSLRDMLDFCKATGAKGNINFDGIGYEKMAVEAPDALNDLRAALQAGTLEVVGASYGQPYGLFHGGESNVRQRVYGVRAVMRLLGVRPKTFWEEEFDFFPQLPQMLRGVGYEYASLFFQWTWHTPEIPREPLPAIWWEGMDGSRLLTGTRNALNLHQWPEDFAGLLDSPILREMPAPGIVQWLELMPSPDWMCRSELLLPQLKALMADPRFELRFATLPEYLEVAKPHAQPRRYTLDDVFHGVSLGKNGDNLRRFSRSGETSLLAAESISAMMGLFGRPYAHWDVYPTWELEEGWRELLSAQHHDNDECEGLCGHIGKTLYRRSKTLSDEIYWRSILLLSQRIGRNESYTFVYNPCGWERQHLNDDEMLYTIPAYGYRAIRAHDPDGISTPKIEHVETEQTLTLRRGNLSVTVDKVKGVITQITSDAFPEGVLQQPIGDVWMTHNGTLERFATVNVRKAWFGTIHVDRDSQSSGSRIRIDISLAYPDGVSISFSTQKLPRPDGGMNAALQTEFSANVPDARLIHDHPYGVSEIKAQGKTYRRKYPTGDWMTSSQWFEDVHNPFTSHSLLDFDDGERGLLILHRDTPAWIRVEGDLPHARCVLSAYDPWDGDYFVRKLRKDFLLIPHSKIDHAQRWKRAQEHRNPLRLGIYAETEEDDLPPVTGEWKRVLELRSSQHGERQSGTGGGDLPPTFGSVWCSAPNVVISAFYREQESVGANLPTYAGRGMGYPYILRLVELNGEATTAGHVAVGYKTNLLGEIEQPLTFETVAPDDHPAQQVLATWNECALSLRPHEIATLYVDIEMGRKQTRDLDSYRSVWATVHRQPEEK
jgi:alpha-mannosidase